MQKTLIVCYGAVAAAAKLLSGFFVMNYGIMGAAGMYALLMIILAVMLMIITCFGIRRKNKND